MCLAVPAQVVALHEDQLATVSLAGVTRKISVDLVDGLSVGDWVAVHVGFALHRIDEEEAKATLSLFESIAEALTELGVPQGEEAPHEPVDEAGPVQPTAGAAPDQPGAEAAPQPWSRHVRKEG